MIAMVLSNATFQNLHHEESYVFYLSQNNSRTLTPSFNHSENTWDTLASTLPLQPSFPPPSCSSDLSVPYASHKAALCSLIRGLSKPISIKVLLKTPKSLSTALGLNVTLSRKFGYYP